MTQYVINIGALPNDGTGDPLRTAFNEVNLNFDQVFAAGPVLSNVQIVNNTILTTNTNGNLVLAPNGIGNIQANTHIVPDQSRIRNLGSPTKYWNTLYAWYGNIQNAQIANGTISIDVGNLHISGGTNGYVLQTDGAGNLTWTAQTGGSGNGTPGGANTQVQFNDAGVFAGRAGFTFNKTANILSVPGSVTTPEVVVNTIKSDDSTFVKVLDGLEVGGDFIASGNIAGDYVSGNIVAPGFNQDVIFNNNGVLGRHNGFNYSSSANTLYVITGSFAGDANGSNGLFVGIGGFTELGSDIMGQFSADADAYSQINIQNISNSAVASGDYIVTADNGNDSTHFVDLGITSSTWDGSQENSLGNTLSPGDGYLYVQDGNLALAVKNGAQHVWFFDTTGNLTVPGNIQTVNTGFPFTSNIANIDLSTLPAVYVELVDNEFGSEVTGQVTITGVVGTTQANGTWYFQAAETNYLQLYNDAALTSPVNGNTWTAYVSGGLAVAAGYSNLSITGGNVSVVTNTGNTWTFGADGSVIFPTLTVDLHNGGTQTGQVLQFGDGSQQAIITGPAPTPAGSNAQRLIIQGQNGGDGEGGDVYVWGGDSNVNGGDIKIYAGDADTAGRGGNIHIAGGRGTTTAGEITLEGGENDGGDGAYVSLTGGRGTSTGGVVSLNGGFGEVTGGDINITGGVGGNGLGSYGNVGISAGASSWAFDNTGNLTLPQAGVVYETNIPFGGLEGKTIALKPSGGTNADQQLLIYPTAGADFNHLHLTTGNLWNTEMFLGNDDFYVKLANTGSIVINTNGNDGNTAQWAFDPYGAILTDSNLFIQTPSGVPATVTAITGSSGSWESNPTSDLATTGGTGTGLTVNVTQEGGYAGTIAIATPGNGYSNGDAITVTSGSSSATFTISVVNNQWTFGVDGNLLVPQGGYIGAAGVKGDGTMLTGGKGNIASLTSFYANVDALNYSSCVTVNADGTLNITTYGDGTGQLGQWNYANTTLYVPGNGSITTNNAVSAAGGNNVTVQAGAADQNNFNANSGGNLNLSGGLGGFNDDGSGGPGGNVNISAGSPGEAGGVAGNVTVNTGTNTWTFDNTGDLILPTISLGSGLDEQTVIQSQRRLIPPFRYSAEITGTAPTVVYTATDVNTTSMKVTMQIQHTGLGFEFFEVFATYTGSTDAWYTVSNRVAPPTIDASTVVVDLNGSNTMQITVTINSGAATSWVTYDAVEFGIPND